MMHLYDRHEPIDLLTLSETLRIQGELELVDGTASIAALVDAVPTAVNVESYARIVKESADKRRLLNILREADTEIYLATDGFESIAGRLTSVLAGLQNGKSKNFVRPAMF